MLFPLSHSDDRLIRGIIEQLLEKAAKAATKTHKERVAEFNEKLENLSEHYDIPKVRFNFFIISLLDLLTRLR